jgi:hypothetical protein
MADDPDDQQTNNANTLPPFVENNDSSHLIAAAHAQRLRQRWRLNRSLYMNNTAILPLADGLHYVDFGFTSAREYWTEVAEPAYERFLKDETRGNAIAAFLLLGPLPDWLWYEQHPGKDTRKSKDYEPFRQHLFSDCPELTLLRDVADVGEASLFRPA